MPSTNESSATYNIVPTMNTTDSRVSSTGGYEHEHNCYFNHSAPAYILLIAVCLTVFMGAVYLIGKVYRNKAKRSRRARTLLFRYWKNEEGESRERPRLLVPFGRKSRM